MTARKTSTRTAASRNLLGNRVKDEVYRQMFLLEESRPDAGIRLALALLRAWIDAESIPVADEEQDWLKKISPICLEMIEASMQSVVPAHR